MNRTKRASMSEITDAVPVVAIEALRRNLLYAMLGGVAETEMKEIVEKQVEKAKEGDTKSAKLIIDMVGAGQRPESRSSHIVEAGGIVDYKVEIRKLIVCLIAFQGPQTTEDVAARLHLTGAVAIDSLMCGWFSREGGKWGLTNEARTRVLDVQAKIISDEPTA